jgi:predicted nucleic acid-binding protein
MAPTHLLDTSVYCQVLKPSPLDTVVARWRRAGEERLAVSAICEAELLYGLVLKSSPRLNDRYDRFLRGRLALLPVDAAVVQAFCRRSAESRCEVSGPGALK